MSEALSPRLNAEEVKNAIKIYKKIEKPRRFDNLKTLSHAQPTNAQTIVSNIRRFGSSIKKDDLRKFKSDLVSLAIFEFKYKKYTEPQADATSKGLFL